MKKILVFAFLITFLASPFAQAPEATVQPTVDIPDILPVVVGTDTFLLPAKDVRVILDTIKSFTAEHEGNWPKSIAGWAILLVTTLVGGKLTQAITSAKAVYSWLKPLLKKTLFIVGLASAGVSAGITYGLALLGDGVFDYEQYATVLPWVTLVAIAIYDFFFKKEKVASVPEPVAAAE